MTSLNQSALAFFINVNKKPTASKASAYGTGKIKAIVVLFLREQKKNQQNREKCCLILSTARKKPTMLKQTQKKKLKTLNFAEILMCCWLNFKIKIKSQQCRLFDAQ